MNKQEKGRQILILEPVCTHNIWGGSKLREVYGYQELGNDIGECWGISAHPKGDSVIRDGLFAGMHLSELWVSHPELFGNLSYEKYPLLVKIIDAKDDLSIQVHPDDAYASAHEDGAFGKTECWYILDCAKDATIILGHHANTREELATLIQQKRFRELIREIPIRKGDFFQIEPGTVHAIKGGTMLLETQQNCDITYRLYDYDRLSNGKPRELHLQESMEVIRVPAQEHCPIKVDLAEENKWITLYACDKYTVFSLKLQGELNFAQKYPFLNVSVLEGAGRIGECEVRKGDHLIIPSGYGLVCLQGKMELIASTVLQ